MAPFPLHEGIVGKVNDAATVLFDLHGSIFQVAAYMLMAGVSLPSYVSSGCTCLGS